MTKYSKSIKNRSQKYSFKLFWDQVNISHFRSKKQKSDYHSASNTVVLPNTYLSVYKKIKVIGKTQQKYAEYNA